MSDKIVVYDRIHFDEHGEPTAWEYSHDGKTWTPVQHHFSKPPFVLIKPMPLPGVVITETWKPKG